MTDTDTFDLYAVGERQAAELAEHDIDWERELPDYTLELKAGER